MGRFASTVVIAGVTFSGCRVILLDAEKFLSAYVGSVAWANSGKANAQIVNVGVKGNAFGLQMDTAEVSKLLTLADNTETAESTLGTFGVQVVDDMYSFNVNCIKDYTQKWITHGLVSEGWAESVIIRVISQSAV